MSLKDKVLAKKPKSETVSVDGDDFMIVGKSKRERGALFAKARKRDGSVDGERLENVMLTACVCDPETGKPVFEESEFKAWDSVDSSLTGPLFAHVMRVCGMDKQDLGPKDSDSTES